jgi:hypothetical protein
MVGIVVDSARLNRTRDEFAGIFESIQTLFQENLKELKGSKMIFGRDRWRNIDPKIRKNIAGFLCQWICDRKHSLAITAIDRKRFFRYSERFPEIKEDPWLAAGLHIALQLQKAHQGIASNKGKTFLFFDENKRTADALAEILFAPPEWTDTFYGRSKKQGRFDQLIDSACTVKSHHVGLVQVADLYAFILRRHIEINEYKSQEMWEGERALIEEYTSMLETRTYHISMRWPKHPQCKCTKWFNYLAPESIKAIGDRHND